jgi:hypothetical protein
MRDELPRKTRYRGDRRTAKLTLRSTVRDVSNTSYGATILNQSRMVCRIRSVSSSGIAVM